MAPSTRLGTLAGQQAEAHLQVCWVHADVRDLGLGVGGPRDEQRAEGAAPEEQRVANDGARHEVRHMRELEVRAAVADGKHVLEAGLQTVVDLRAVSQHAVGLSTQQLPESTRPLAVVGLKSNETAMRQQG